MLNYFKWWFGRADGSKDSQASSFATVPDEPQYHIDPDVQRLTAQILRLYNDLSLKHDIKPCYEVNKLFEELVALCTQTLSESVADKVMNNARVLEILPSLRHISATAESHLESHWAEIISGRENEADEDSVYSRFKNFPYFNNYTDLTRMELAAVSIIHPAPITKVAFIGSGPLPVTSLQLLHTLPHDVEILNIDHSAAAISQSKELCSRLGSRGKGMSFLCSEAGSKECDLREFDVVYLAALVGSKQDEKEKVLVDVVAGMREGAVLVVRSAHGLRKLLYAEFDPMTEEVARCLDVLLVVHPFNHVVNSVIVGRARS